MDSLTRAKNADYDRGLQCLEGTRSDILHAVFEWMDNSASENIFWLNGPAGCGKSTIASTVAHMLDESTGGVRKLGLGTLAATFFCKRNDAQLNKPSLLIPTMAFRLAYAYPLLKGPIIKALNDNPDIGDSPILNQFNKLIEEPLSTVASQNVTNVIIVIDALDECGDTSSRKALLRCFEQASALPRWFRIFITSRPEDDIRAALCNVSVGYEVDIHSEDNKSDVAAYIQQRIVSLRRDHPTLGSDWPDGKKLNEIISKSGDLFIWVRLAFDFIEPKSNPATTMDGILSSSFSKFHTQLDALYHTVLHEGLVEEEHSIRQVLGIVVVAKVPL